MKALASCRLILCFISFVSAVLKAGEPPGPEAMTAAQKQKEIADLLSAQEKSEARLKALGHEPKAPEALTSVEKDKEIAVLMTTQEKNLIRLKALGWERSGTVMFFHGGVRLLSPFQVRLETDPADPTKLMKRADGLQYATLEKGSTTPSGFLEFVYSNRWAWNEQRILATDTESQKTGQVFRLKTLFTPSELLDAHFWDVDARLVYNFAKGGDSDAAAIVGGGDFGLEVTVSRQINRDILPANPRLGDGAGSLGFDICYGLTTEKSSFDAHHRIIAGPSYSISKPNESGRWTLLTMRVGYGGVETVRFLNKTTREVRLKQGDVPDYDLEPAIGFEAELFYPIGKDAAVTLGTRIYGKLNPNPWTVYVGYSKSISDIAKGILPNSEPGKATPKVPAL